MGRYQTFRRDIRKPSIALPPNSCDTHFHVFGSRERYPVLPGIEHDMPDATVEAMLNLHATLGFQRGVIITTTAHGPNHQVLLDALAVAGPNYRACALSSVLTDTSDAYIAKLDAAGIRGARFGFLKLVGREPPLATVGRAIDRCRELGWYCKVQPDYDVPLESLALFEDTDVPVVIDHMGRARPEQGLDGPVISKVLSLLERGNYWLLLSNGYKVSRRPPLWDDVVPITRKFIEAAPDRVIWATDWPHTFHTEPPPDDGDLVEFLIRATDAAERQKILVDNPARLFGFGA
jgi:predicted TIM-barrel fold metal-dependent hydrolase